MISNGSSDAENWKFSFASEINYIWKYIKTEKSYFNFEPKNYNLPTTNFYVVV